jgi:hypothetical protein
VGDNLIMLDKRIDTGAGSSESGLDSGDHSDSSGADPSEGLPF